MWNFKSSRFTIFLSNRDSAERTLRERDLFLGALEDTTPSTGKLQQAFLRFRQKYNRS